AGLSREGARAREHGRLLRSAAAALRALLRRAIREPEHARIVPRRLDARRGDAIRRRLLAPAARRRRGEMGMTARRYRATRRSWTCDRRSAAGGVEHDDRAPSAP